MPLSARETLRELEQTAVLAELARPLVHECNNFLNTLLLQIALLEGELAEQHRSNFARIRHDGRALAKLLQEWQRFRPPAKSPAKTDLNTQLERAVEALQDEQNSALPIQLHLADHPVKIPAAPQDLKRLCYFLLTHALNLRDSGPAAPLEVVTAANEEMKSLTLRQPSANSSWLNGFRDDKEGGARLLPAACRGLVHRLQGQLQLEGTPDQVGVLAIRWPQAGS